MKCKISAKIERFRRAGIEFTKKGRDVDVDEKTLEILKAEPMLSVEKTPQETVPDEVEQGKAVESEQFPEKKDNKKSRR